MYKEKKVKKSGKIKDNDFRFNISDVPFGRKLSFLSIKEGLAPTESRNERKQLILSRLQKNYIETKEMPPGLMYMRPMNGRTTLPYYASATPSLMELATEFGYIQFCFEDKDTIRIRGRGIGLRFYSKINFSEMCIARLDGTYQISYDVVGEFLFVPISGKFEFDSEWVFKRGGIDDVTIDVSPDENGEFEIALHYAESCAKGRESYKPFEECVEDAQLDYSEWLDMMPDVPGRYDDIKKLAAYSIWICHVAPMGILKNNITLFAKDNSAFSWHQAYFAMAAVKDVDMSVEFMRCMFDYQDEYGEIPDLVDDQYINILATKPPFHGFAMLYILDRIGDRMTKEHCETLYLPLSKWYDWWMTLRDTDGDGVPQYNQGCESGMDFTQMLSKGTPVEAPDLLAYMALMAEALGRLAKMIGKDEKAKAWEEAGKKHIEVLINEFWDGERFVARLSSSHDLIEFDEVEAYVPLMLGSRLPDKIVDKLTETLADPEKYYTDIGFRSAPKSYDQEGRHVPGFIGGFAQVKLIPGLYEAGKKELARKVLTGFCEANLKNLPNFGYLEIDPPKVPGAPDSFISSFGKCSSLSSAIFLVMASYLAEMSK